MKVAGSNNLGFQAPAPKAAGGKASQGREKSSFDSILGQTRSQNDPTSATEQQSHPDTQREKEAYKQPAQTQVQGQAKTKISGDKQASKPDAAIKSPQAVAVPGVQTSKISDDQEPMAGGVESADGLPAGQNAPGFGGPGLTNDRALSPPVNPAFLNPLTGQKTAAPQEDTANSLTRRVVWNDFLRKMNDLGVSAEDVLHAFGSLSEQDLAQPPEQTVDKVVMALGLDGQQAQMAKQYFHELIAKTKSKSFGEELASSSRQISLSLMTQRELQRKTLNKSLDNMNQNFFMKNQMAKPNQPLREMQRGADGKLEPMPLPNADTQELNTLDNSNALSESPLAIPGITNAIPQATEASAAAAQVAPVAQPMMAAPRTAEMNKLVGEMQSAAPEDKKSIDQLIKNFTSRQAQSPTAQAAVAGPAAAGMAATSAPGTVAAPAGAPAAAVSALNSIFSSGKGKDSSNDDKGDDSTDASSMANQLTSENRMGGHEAVKGDFQSALKAQAPGAPQPMSAPELVQQAHLMVKDGGGEMKVTLHPDGLGEVAMRVSVTDGKVNVQMITESDEAKKLIERQIGDLKSGLAQNHLQVESIKVDTASNLGKQLEQQYHDAQRQQAHANLEQFRQDQQGWRRSFFETGAVNPYRSQGEAPRDVKAPSTSAASRKEGSRRLDLVA